MVANSNAIEAKINVAQRLPDSRETVENIAAPKASANPAIASRKRTHTSGSCNFNQRGSRSSAEDTCAGAIRRPGIIRGWLISDWQSSHVRLVGSCELGRFQSE